MKILLLCAALFMFQGCATSPTPVRHTSSDPLWAASEVGHRLSEIELLNKGQPDKAKRLLEMDINALLVVLYEYDKAGELQDETKDVFESAKTYRREHPFKVSEQDEKDFPNILFNADEQIQEIIRKR
jgi:hypothetical protein